ncbi:acetate--CoA ligase family protein [Aquimarina muelleri]|uniref:Acetyl-CoA synthetase n=1 Tax=Aquimarina muelleri TaxID=279356 RepID=A0A918JUZ5_9FLAO|nr:acetate--CoA ligase family protein [Aquimarina muelleri]MCX2762286.1 acetate--CoA ligase family protein [Aquimarina muelleri]GGX17842.1 acetyl-CoA synthetase [Aquimarina muelleri]
MINEQLTNPKSIVIIGGSNTIRKPGGKIVKNCIDGGYLGELRIVNPKEKQVQGIISYTNVNDIPNTDLAILAIPAKYCLETITVLAEQKNTKAFIIISAGFGETNEIGSHIEKEIVDIINSVNGCLIGPNCIGVLNKNYKGVFTTPIPEYNSKGCDLISGSGATAVFIMEAGMLLGVPFANVYSVGNGAQTGVEDVLEYMDIHYNPDTDPAIKLLYLEAIKDPQKLLKHASSLINKGVKIAAIKAGSTAEGSRAASSHTGAIASSDMTVRALFKKAGIVYCSSREELLSVASIFKYKKLTGKNIAIITHAGGSAVMLADVLSKGGLQIPTIEGEDAKKLETYLYPGSSVSNPIDFLATGTAEQLGIIMDYCEHKFDFIDAMVVVFGSPGLFDVENVYNVLSVKLDVCSKPIFPVLPSVINAHKEIKTFLSKGNINFPDEVVLGKALCEVYKTSSPSLQNIELPKINTTKIRSIIDQATDGYLTPEDTALIIDASGIPRSIEVIENSKENLLSEISQISFPIVMKVVGPLHKSDTQGVILNVNTIEEVSKNFDVLMDIKGAIAVMVQPMLSGLELFVGVKKEPRFNHTILCGLGGIFIEILNDVAAALSPISDIEAQKMIRSLRGYELLQGSRGKDGINEIQFIEIIQRLSALVETAPEITEMDINPLIGTKDAITAVDVRIKIEKI